MATAATMLTVDPSIVSTGWSVWRRTEHGAELLGAGLVHLNDSWRLRPRAERWTEMALQVRHAGKAVLGGSPESAVLEWPRILPVTHGSKGDPNDILQLAGVVGAISHELRLSGCSVLMARPEEWKGQATKGSPRRAPAQRCR
jgi:hypothetical protein